MVDTIEPPKNRFADTDTRSAEQPAEKCKKVGIPFPLDQQMSRFVHILKIIGWILLMAIPLTTGSAMNGWADEAPPLSADGASPAKMLRFAMLHALGGVNIEDAKVAIDFYWSRHLKGVFPGYVSQFEILPNVPSAAKSVKSGRLHGLSLGIAQYLRLKERVRLRPVFISSRLDHPLESYLLVVRKGVDWQALSALSTRHLVTDRMTEPNIGRMWLETVLKKGGLPPGQTFFTRMTQGAKPARIVLPVFFGQADICLIPESAYATMGELNPQISRRLTVLQRSPGFVKTIHCTTEALPDWMVERFIRRGVRMDDGVDGRQLLLIFHVKKNFVFQPEFIENSESIYRKYQSIVD